MNYYAFILDDQGNFDCILEADSLNELKEHIKEYLAEFVGHSVSFVFHGSFVDFQNTVASIE